MATSRTPAKHARALLAWLQGRHGRTGTIAVTELEAIYSEMCFVQGWNVERWSPVRHEFARLLRGAMQIVERDGRRTVLYRVPRARSDAPCP